jgi:hypothetical protein
LCLRVCTWKKKKSIAVPETRTRISSMATINSTLRPALLHEHPALHINDGILCAVVCACVCKLKRKCLFEKNNAEKVHLGN